MNLKSSLVIVCVAFLFIQHTPICEANWFTNLFSRSSQHPTKNDHATVYGGDHSNKGSWTHELIAAAAGFEAMRAYENQQARNTGQPPSHSMVKDILAGLAAAAVDRLIETKGLDWIDAQRAKSGAARHTGNMVDEHVQSGQSGNGNNNNNNNQDLYDGQQGNNRNRGSGNNGRENHGRNNDNNNDGDNFNNYDATTAEYK